MLTYKCFDIVTEDGIPYNSCVVTVPEHDMSCAVERQEHLVAVSGALESLVGSVESFRYERVEM